MAMTRMDLLGAIDRFRRLLEVISEQGDDLPESPSQDELIDLIGQINALGHRMKVWQPRGRG